MVAPFCLGFLLALWGRGGVRIGESPGVQRVRLPGIKGSILQRYRMVVNAWNGNKVELLIKGLSLISEYPSFRV